jgi:transcriptional regulator with XRE-family HTH domain
MNGPEKLKRWLQLNSLTQEDFATQVGVHQPAVHKWLFGESIPRWPRLRKIHAATSGFVGPSDWLAAPAEKEVVES